MAARDNVPIRVLSSLTGVSATTLRAWERRYGFLKPRRTPSGHRLYGAHHVELIRRALALRERGVPFARMRDMLSRDSARALPAEELWRKPISRMFAAVTRFDEADLDEIYDEAMAVHPVDRVTHGLLLPLLRRLGERWQTVAGAVAEEHFFAAYVRSKLGARLLARLRYDAGPRLVAACCPGELHELGLMLFAIEARAAGARVAFLGADTPLEEIRYASSHGGFDGIVLSVTIDPSPGVLDKRLAKLTRDAGVPVFVGGTGAVRHRLAIAAAGAIPVQGDMEFSVRLITARCQGHRRRKR